MRLTKNLILLDNFDERKTTASKGLASGKLTFYTEILYRNFHPNAKARNVIGNFKTI